MSTIKFKSNYLPQRAKVLTQRLHAFLSPRRANVTQCNGRIIYLKVLAQRSNLTPQRAKNIANQRANITQWSNYLPQRAEILSQRSQRVNSTGKEYCESNIATGEKYCEWAAKHIKMSCLPREY